MAVRVTQAPVEVVIQTTSAARVTQAPVEVVVLTTSTSRVTQASVEVVIYATTNALVTQAGIEAIVQPTPAIRITQAGIEALISNTRFARTLPASAILSLTHTRTIPSTAKLGGTTRTVPASAVLELTGARIVFATAEIGFRRYVPAQAQFLGSPRRSVFSSAIFNQPGLVPASASFWQNTPHSRIVSSSRTKVMALASKLVGGTVGNYLGIVPAANNAPAPPGWEQLNYNDAFWPYCISSPGGIMPFPFPDPTINSIDFDWRWPNPTGDYSPSLRAGPPPTSDPSFAINIFRHTFGMPLDPTITAATSGLLWVGVSSGVFIAQVFQVMINGILLPYYANNLNNPSANINIWSVPLGTLRPGKNVISFGTNVYLCFGIFGNSAQFQLVLDYIPPLIGMAQVIG